MDQDIAENASVKLPNDLPIEYPYSPRAPTLPLDDPPIELKWLAPYSPALVLAALAVVFAAGNVALLPLTNVFQEDDYGAVWVYLVGGMFLAQAGLFAAILVFGVGRFVVRLALCWAAATPLWLCWAAGLVLNLHQTRPYNTTTASELCFGLFVMPLIALAIQAPLWFFRLYLGWRLVDTNGSESAPQPLSIRDYFTGTAIAALSITCARLAVKPSEINPEYWAGWSLFFVSASGISLASVVPAMLLMFRNRQWSVGLGLLVLYGAAAVSLIAGLFAIGSQIFPGVVSPPDLWTSFGIAITFMSFAGFLGLGLKALSDRGYHLILRRRQG